MEKTAKPKLIAPQLISIMFIAMGINSIAMGIAQHQTWRIVLAATGMAFFVAIITMILYKIRAKNKKAA